MFAESCCCDASWLLKEEGEIKKLHLQENCNVGEDLVFLKIIYLVVQKQYVLEWLGQSPGCSANNLWLDLKRVVVPMQPDREH